MSNEPVPQGVPEWTLGWRLQRALAHANVTSELMAQELGVSRSTISRWMNDHGAPPRTAYVKQWALRTGVPHAWLAHGIVGDGPDGTSEQGVSVSRCTAPSPGGTVLRFPALQELAA